MCSAILIISGRLSVLDVNDLYTPLLFLQGYLDEQFNQLEELQDDSSPNFVEEVVALFFRNSSRLLTSIEQAL